MEDYKREFIRFMVDCQVLRFGSFVTKSGRNTPFFINTGYYRTGSQLKELGTFYAKAIHASFGEDFDVLFGPAYKGIPLSVATTIALNNLYGQEVRYCSNRKEIKDHGDKGIEDVTTSGKSIRETMPILMAQGKIQVTGLCISVDRCERGTGGKSAVEEISEEYGIRVRPIVTMKEVVEVLYNHPVNGKVVIDDRMMEEIRAYYQKYGVEEQADG